MFKKILIGIVLLVVIVSIASSGGDDKVSPTSAPVGTTSTPQSEATPDKPQEPAKPTVKTYKAGMYKIGQDMPAGEYVLMANSMAYYQATKDSTGQLESIISNDNFSNRSIITVVDGQYLTLRNCTAYAFNDAPKVKLSADGFLPEGMYKVSIDLPAGEYKATADSMGYAEVSSNSSHDMGNIVSNDNFQGEKYITVKDGQYLKLTRAKIKVK